MTNYVRKNEKRPKSRFFTKSHSRALIIALGARIVWEDLGHFCKKYSTLCTKIHLSVANIYILSILTLRNCHLKVNQLWGRYKSMCFKWFTLKIFPFLMVTHGLLIWNYEKNNCLGEWMYDIHCFSEDLVQFFQIVFYLYWFKNGQEPKVATDLAVKRSCMRVHCRERNIAQDNTHTVYMIMWPSVSAVGGICSLLNVVASGHRQLCRPLVVNRLNCDSGMFWSPATVSKIAYVFN